MVGKIENFEEKPVDSLKKKKAHNETINQQNIKMAKKLDHSQEIMNMALVDGELAWWDWNLTRDEVKYERSEEVLGFQDSHLKGYNNGVRIHPDDVERCRSIVKKFKNSEISIYDSEYRVITNTDEIRWIADKGKILEKDPAGKPIRAVGISQDITTRKKAAEMIKESGKRMKLAIEIAKLGMWDWNLANDTFVLDQRINEILEYLPGNLKEWFKHVHPEDLGNLKAANNAILNGESEVIDFEYRTISTPGKIKWVHDLGQVVEWDDNGKPVRAIGTSQDITHRKESEKKIYESQRGMQMALKGANLGTWDWELVKDTFNLDKKTIENLGFKPSTTEARLLKSEAWYKFVHPDDLEKVLKKDHAVASGITEVIDYEYRFMDYSGNYRWVRSWGKVAEWDNQGKPIHAIGITQNIQQQKLTEETLKESRNCMKLALKGSDAGMWDYNIPLDTWLFDECSVELLGCYPKTDEEYNLLIYLGRKKSYLSNWDKAITEQVPLYDAEYRIKTPSGQFKWILDKGKIVEWDHNNNPIRVMGTIQDITKRKEAEEMIIERTKQLEASNQQLEEAKQKLKKAYDELEQRVEARTIELNRMNIELKKSQDELIRSERLVALGNMVAGVAHEINTPVGICVTESTFLTDQTDELLELIQNNKLTQSRFKTYAENAKATSSSIHRNLIRVGKLIQSFKRVATDQTTDECRLFNLKRYLEEVILNLGAKIKQKQLTVTINCTDDIEIFSYPGVFAQIITNFVINSVLHGFANKSQGLINIDISVNKNFLTVIYKDNGEGMDDTILKQVFDPFFTTKRTQDGSGLGMYIVYNIVTQKLKGKIQCYSAPGQGVEFQMNIPLKTNI